MSRRRRPRSAFAVVCTARGQHRKVPISEVELTANGIRIKGTAHAKMPERPDDLTSFTFSCPKCGRHVQLLADFVKENLISGLIGTYIDISRLC